MAVVVSYTNVPLMLQTLPEIGSISHLSSADLATHASAAESLVNAKIAKRYSLPFTDDVPLLQSIATDLAIYRVLTGGIIIKDEHPWFQRYKNAMEILDDVAAGEVPLVTSSGDVISGRSDEVSGMQAWSNTMDYHPTHWEGPWTLHDADQDKIDDEADERDLDTIGKIPE